MTYAFKQINFQDIKFSIVHSHALHVISTIVHALPKVNALSLRCYGYSNVPHCMIQTHRNIVFIQICLHQKEHTQFSFTASSCVKYYLTTNTFVSISIIKNHTLA